MTGTIPAAITSLSSLAYVHPFRLRAGREAGMVAQVEWTMTSPITCGCTGLLHSTTTCSPARCQRSPAPSLPPMTATVGRLVARTIPAPANARRALGLPRIHCKPQRCCPSTPQLGGRCGPTAPAGRPLEVTLAPPRLGSVRKPVLRGPKLPTALLRPPTSL